VAKLRGPKRPSLTIPQAAEYTGLSVRQIKRMIGERALPYWKTAASQQGHVLRQGAGE
jgi:excisionase family DNA binding protein